RLAEAERRAGEGKDRRPDVQAARFGGRRRQDSAGHAAAGAPGDVRAPRRPSPETAADRRHSETSGEGQDRAGRNDYRERHDFGKTKWRHGAFDARTAADRRAAGHETVAGRSRRTAEGYA